MRILLAFFMLLLSEVVLARTCNVNTDRVKSPWHYTNPNTACGIGFSMPGLPDFSLDWELPDLNVCNAVRDFADDLIGDDFDDIIHIPPSDNSSGEPGRRELPSGTELPSEICKAMPHLCGEETIPPEISSPVKEKEKSDIIGVENGSPFCHPNNPNDSRNHSSCQYRKIEEAPTQKPQIKAAVHSKKQQTEPPKPDMKEDNYWKKRYRKKDNG